LFFPDGENRDLQRIH